MLIGQLDYYNIIPLNENSGGEMTMTILTSRSFHACAFSALVSSMIAALVVLVFFFFFFYGISRVCVYLLKRIIAIIKLIVVESKVLNERRCYLLTLIIGVHLIPRIPHDK